MGNQKTVYVLGLDYDVKDEITWSEAVTHILQGKMTPFKVDETRRIRSAGGSVDMAWPLIVRLNYWVKVPRPREVDLESRASRTEILRRDGWTCAYCGDDLRGGARVDENGNTVAGGVRATVDHIIPKSRGGGWTWGNLVASCVPCNSFKDNRTPEEAGMKLLWMPHTARNRFSGVQQEVWRILDSESGGFVEEAILYEGLLAEA